MKTPRVGLSLAPDEGFRAAASPLFEAGLVDVLEWSFDIPWAFGRSRMPVWVGRLCDVYSNAGCLYGHGVAFSALSAAWEKRQERWLERLAKELEQRRYVHVSEHFGFMSARGFLPGTPLPVPMTDEALRVGCEALSRLGDVVGAPIGLENLATVFGPRDVAEQADFLTALLEPLDGFLLLDLHNLYCQAWNFGIPLGELLARLPLDRVREIHVAGGSLWRPPGDEQRVIRRDTHDAPIPEDVFDAVTLAIRACENLEIVVVERIAGTIRSAKDADDFQRDFRRLRLVVEQCEKCDA